MFSPGSTDERSEIATPLTGTLGLSGSWAWLGPPFDTPSFAPPTFAEAPVGEPALRRALRQTVCWVLVIFHIGIWQQPADLLVKRLDSTGEVWYL